MNKLQQRGFTLIELVIVITIIGILAAIAFPRFVNSQADARIAKLQGALGALNSAANIAHGAALPRYGAVITANCNPANGLTNPPHLDAVGTGDICTEAGNISMTNGYPAGSYAGIVMAAGLQSANGVPTQATLQTAGWDVTVAGTTVTVRPQGASTPTSCQFTYTSALASSQPVFSAITTTGC